MELGNRLNSLRSAHNLTYQQLSDASGVPVGTVKSILTGVTASPGFEPVCAMVRAMGESIDAFYAGASPEPSADAQKLADDHNLLPLRGDIRVIAGEAIHAVYQTDVYHNLHNNLRWWRAVALFETAFIFFLLVWDITHPNMGYIQYAATVGQIALGLALRLLMT